MPTKQQNNKKNWTCGLN